MKQSKGRRTEVLLRPGLLTDSRGAFRVSLLKLQHALPKKKKTRTQSLLCDVIAGTGRISSCSVSTYFDEVRWSYHHNTTGWTHTSNTLLKQKCIPSLSENRRPDKCRVLCILLLPLPLVGSCKGRITGCLMVTACLCPSSASSSIPFSSISSSRDIRYPATRLEDVPVPTSPLFMREAVSWVLTAFVRENARCCS